MKSIYDIYEVSILADIDDQINAYDNSVPDRIEKWIKENYDCTGLKISKKSNKDNLYEVTARSAEVKNKNITSLTNGTFEWKEVNTFFDCRVCKNLSSLEGAPKKVGIYWTCVGCSSLTSLEGAPREVRGSFDCSFCYSLKSLEGAPKEVGGDFNCNRCNNLKSLKGAPKEVGGDFHCYRCTSLTSLEGAPKEVGGDFYCFDCKTQFTENDVKKVSNAKGKIVIIK